jgi:hypothetical protein
LLEESNVRATLDTVWELDKQEDVTVIYDLLDWRSKRVR